LPPLGIERTERSASTANPPKEKNYSIPDSSSDQITFEAIRNLKNGVFMTEMGNI